MCLVERLPERKVSKTVYEGEAALDAVLLLGYRVETIDSGAITATLGDEVIRGQTTENSSAWRNPSAMYRVRERVYVVQLRARVRDAQVEAKRGPTLERPEAHQATARRSEAQAWGVWLTLDAQP
jgi:hypothetical protein